MRRLLICSLFILYTNVLLAQKKEQWSYFTEYGTLILQVNDNKIRGSFPHESGSIEGILTDSVMNGKWKQSDGGGDIKIYFSGDFSTFTIHYNHVDTKDSTAIIWKSDWTGMRTPEIIVREYKTAFGKMLFHFQGTQVEAFYPWYNGKIIGELTGTELKGIWLQSNRGFGNIHFKFSSDFLSFEGTYNDFNFHSDKWYKWNGKQ
jgi:hypothetical protein